MRIKFISFYTPRYKDCAIRLVKSLDMHGLDFDVQELPEFDGEGQEKFLMAVRHKPRFILEKFKEFSDTYDAVVWTDADSEVLRPPKLFGQIDADVAVRYREVFELLSGTMFWRVCFKVAQFLPEWVRIVESGAGEGMACPEQQILADIIDKAPLEVYRLPEEYVYIAEHEKVNVRERNNVAREVDPVIYHHQMSRETRNATD